MQSNELNNLYMEYSENGGFEWESEVEHTLLRFEFINQSWYQSLQDLSGGERTRARLAKIAISKPKMLILDEPTNHLDIDSISWLANWIQRYQGPLLLVFHNRDFINQVSHTTYTLSSKGTKRYKGGYDNYQKQTGVNAVFIRQERQLIHSIRFTVFLKESIVLDINRVDEKRPLP
ncbi:ATP-binding cassette domain-containing protein [Alicyclobacillus tolerans]|uniref:ATP-binding cassette domain-containing protein n=1 Tax=Alicyclobacillus tolerans TaxID=90970 RepID=UPI003B981DB6